MLTLAVIGRGHHAIVKEIEKHPEQFQLLCANCNQIKKHENEEWGA